MADEKGFTLWFTGLSGAGKTTISGTRERRAARPRLAGRGARRRRGPREPLQGPRLLQGGPRHEHPRIAFVADLLSRNGVPVITAAISPYRALRDEARELMGDRFIEVFVKASVEDCDERDVKGLYEKAFRGEIKEFTGVSDPYEPPLNAELTLDTETTPRGVRREGHRDARGAAADPAAQPA